VDGEVLRFTGKERDSETGLDYFGARYMSSAQGRFTSPDPSNMSVDFWLPQSWNRYAYVGNNPFRYVDQNGLWWTQTHNLAIQEALPGLSSADLKSVQSGSLAADTSVMGVDAQNPAMSFVHHMSAGNTSDPASAIGAAIGAEANFVASGQAEAVTEQANWIASGHTGLSPKALQIFGNFTHPAVDSTSPAHEGYQPWGGCSRLSSLIPGIGGQCVSAGGLWHAARESPLAFRGERQANAISIIQSFFIQTFGQDAFQQAIGTSEADRKAPHPRCLLNRDTGGCVE
jgi:RHS repeat-associated protein